MQVTTIQHSSNNKYVSLKLGFVMAPGQGVTYKSYSQELSGLGSRWCRGAALCVEAAT